MSSNSGGGLPLEGCFGVPIVGLCLIAIVVVVGGIAMFFGMISNGVQYGDFTSNTGDAVETATARAYAQGTPLASIEGTNPQTNRPGNSSDGVLAFGGFNQFTVDSPGTFKYQLTIVTDNPSGQNTDKVDVSVNGGPASTVEIGNNKPSITIQLQPGSNTIKLFNETMSNCSDVDHRGCTYVKSLELDLVN